MHIAFIQGGSRWKLDCNGVKYTDSNLTKTTWERYEKYSESITVILRTDNNSYNSDYARSSFNEFDEEKYGCCMLPDIYNPISAFFSIKKRSEIKHKIFKELKSADRLVVREPGNYYTNYAIKVAQREGIPYLVEVTSNVFDTLWYHGALGKIKAILGNRTVKKIILHAPFALYVTNEYLQSKYPTKGKSVGCSDVDIDVLSRDEFDIKEKNVSDQELLRIGTAAYLDVDYKGQKDVIRAIANLDKKGIHSFEYHLIGNGTGEVLLKLANDLNISDRVIIDGSLPHEEVTAWLDKLDVYVQPSYTEGLCRSLVEAMGRGCPIICSNVGGNCEIVNKRDMFSKKEVSEIEELLCCFIDKSRRAQSIRGSKRIAEKYSKEYLGSIRNSFMDAFFRNGTEGIR